MRTVPCRWSNLTSTEKAQGLTLVPGFDLLDDESVGFGGPIVKDRVWFYYAQRYRDNDIADVNVDFYSINPLLPTYNPTTVGGCIVVALTGTTRCA